MSKLTQSMPRWRHASAQVPLPVIGASRSFGREEFRRSLISSPVQLPGVARTTAGRTCGTGVGMTLLDELVWKQGERDRPEIWAARSKEKGIIPVVALHRLAACRRRRHWEGRGRQGAPPPVLLPRLRLGRVQ